MPLAACVRSHDDAGEPWRQVWPLVKVVGHQARSADRFVVLKQHEGARHCLCLVGRALCRREHVLKRLTAFAKKRIPTPAGAHFG